MALQSLTTTPIATGTQTVAPAPGPDDTNANSNLLGTNGTTPLIPAFLLSGLLVVGIVMMCWWKRLASRRVVSGDAGMRMSGTVGMFVLQVPGIQPEAQEGRRKTVVGPRPRLWDTYLKKDALYVKEAKWREVKPVSASYIPASSQPASRSIRNNPFRTITTSPSTGHMISPKSKPPEPSVPLRPSHLRVSVLISMPTPASQHAHIGDEEERSESSVSSEIEIKERSPEDMKEGLEDLNLVLGIAEVPVVQRKG